MSGLDKSRMGPGLLILIVGPSGAGKDTLIRGAQRECADEHGLVFARRVVTRDASADEDNETLTASGFDDALAQGAFALHWAAHGHRYALRRSIDEALQRGDTVIANVSRAVIDEARRRYARTRVVAITAPAAVLRARLLARGRASDGDVGRRLDRDAALDLSWRADFTIENASDPAIGVARLTAIIRTGA